MFCRLCLCHPQILIPVIDESGSESQDIVDTVIRFLGLQLTVADRICVTCWASVDNFRKFCCLVTERQAQFTILKEQHEQLEQGAEQQEKPLSSIPAEDITNEFLANGNSRQLPECNIAPDTSEFVTGQHMEPETATSITQAQEPVLESNSISMKEAMIVQKSDEIHQKCDQQLVLTDEIGDKTALRDTNEGINTFNPEISSTFPAKIRDLNKSKTAEDDTLPVDAFESSPTKINVAKLGNPVALNDKLLLKSTNARKIGRPRRDNASVSLEEDRLIASHMQLSCDICTVQITTFDELKRHFKTAHDVNGYAICCQKRLYKRGLLIDHINVHRNPAYFTCSLCENIFADRICLRNHFWLKHNDAEQSPHKCVHCGRKFAKSYFLQRHLLKHVDASKCTFRCDHCDKSYPNESRLKSHIRNVHSEVGMKVCNYCGAIVRGRKNFEHHLAKHESGSSTSKVQCNVCGQYLSSNSCLRIHMERHMDKQEHLCLLCGKDAPSRLALKGHMRYYHGKTDTLHVCTVCQRVFKIARGLREHMTTHTGETLYSCNYCGKRFKCSSNLHAHRKWKHAVEWTHDKETAKSKLTT